MNIDRMMRVQRKMEADSARWERVLGLEKSDDAREMRRVGVADFGMSEDVGLPSPATFDTQNPSMPGERPEPLPVPPGLDMTGGMLQ